MSVRIVLCYNSETILLMEALKAYVYSLPMVTFESWNEDLFTELKKSRKAKGHFAARQIPFCGIFVDNKAVKGFYTETEECTFEAIKTYLDSLILELTTVRLDKPFMNVINYNK